MMQAAQVWGNGIMRDLRHDALQGMNVLYGTAEPSDAKKTGSATAGK